MAKQNYDRYGNLVGDGSWHHDYHVVDFSDMPEIDVRVSKSNTSESVYVRYLHCPTMKSITCRFSTHISNAVLYDVELNGHTATRDEILYKLGLKKCKWVANTKIHIPARQVGKAKFADYEIAELTLDEMYALGEGADISMYTNKVAKGSNWLILGTYIGRRETIHGHYEYYD